MAASRPPLVASRVTRLDLVDILAVGAVGLLAVFTALLRRDRRRVDCDDEGLHVGARTFAWHRIRRLDFVHGGQGGVFLVSTREGPVRFDDDRIDAPLDEVKRAIIAGAELEREMDAETPAGIPFLPGDVFESWRRPEPEEDDEERVATRGTSGGSAAGIAALVALIAKGWNLIVGGLAAANLGSIGATLLSMGASAWVYAQLGGWRFALGLIGLLIVHELGHAAVMVAKRLRTTPIVFIPMFGAFIAIKDQFRDASVEAETALGGPVAGALGATACLAVAHETADPFWGALAFFGGLLNLFNLMPVSPLDGGRVVTAISTWLWIVGLVVILGLAALSGNPLLIIIALLGALRAARTWRRQRPRGADYYALGLGYRTAMAVAYFAVCGWLAWLMVEARTLAEALHA